MRDTPVYGMGQGFSDVYLLEIAKGNITGESLIKITSDNPNLGSVAEDIWDAGALSEITYITQTVNFTPGEILDQQATGATATIAADIDNGTSGTLQIRDITGIFVSGEVITDAAGGSATSNSAEIETLELIYPVASESLEIICENANDTSAGTGAQSVDVITLTDDYIEQTTTVATNGHAASLLSGLHFRPQGGRTLMRVTSSGSGQKNEGSIILRVAGAGAIRGMIQPGMSNTFDSHYTVKAKQTAYYLKAVSHVPKNEDVQIIPQYMLPGTNTWLSLDKIKLYQSSVIDTFQAIESFPEKTDIRISGFSTNDAQDVSARMDLLLVDNQ